MASETIKNIIFDLGGVLVNIDPERTARAFAALSNTDPVDIMALHTSNSFFVDYEKGLIDDVNFRDHIRQFLKTDATDYEIDQAWAAMLLNFPAYKIKLLEKARTKYRIFLLSNTNHIHKLKFEKDFRNLTHTDIHDFFENVHYSFVMHTRKPEREIFLSVLKENNLMANETLLIDDSLPNIKSADSLGIKTRYVQINQEKIEIEF